MPQTSSNLFAAEQLRLNGFTGKIFATVKYKEDEQLLKDNGVDFIFNFTLLQVPVLPTNLLVHFLKEMKH